GSIAFFFVLALAMLGIGRFSSARIALSAAIGGYVVVGSVSAIASRQAIARVDADAVTQSAGWTTVDRILTPLPMNPLCWELILVQFDGARYALRRASVSIAPSLQCPPGLGGRITAPLQQVRLPD